MCSHVIIRHNNIPITITSQYHPFCNHTTGHLLSQCSTWLKTVPIAFWKFFTKYEFPTCNRLCITARTPLQRIKQVGTCRLTFICPRRCLGSCSDVFLHAAWSIYSCSCSLHLPTIFAKLEVADIPHHGCPKGIVHYRQMMHCLCKCAKWMQWRGSAIILLDIVHQYNDCDS